MRRKSATEGNRLLSAQDFIDLRATAAETLTETALVKRPTLVSDSAGGYTETAAPTAVTVACRVAPSRSPAELALAERVSAVQGWMVTVPYATDVRATDRLIVGTRTFEVIGILGAETYETARRCVCVEIL
jgi:head-tail adaptor